MTTAPTSVSVLTPPGTVAIATLALVGPRAWVVARELFRPAGATPLPDPPPLDHFWHGHFGGLAGDTVVLTIKRLEPVPWVEVHCHGGQAVVRWLTQTLLDQGLSVCPWPDALGQAGESPLRVLAAVELSRATTRRTAAILLDQWHGAFENALNEIDRLLAVDDRTAAQQRLADLLRHAALGRHMTHPWRVVVAGTPNVGKSSLVNALAGFQRSVVTAVPGTTRDVVTTAVALDGWPVELIDTAGLHDPTDILEEQGIARARATTATADLCLWVVAADMPPVWPEVPLPSVLRVVNKVDLPAVWDTAAIADAVHISARSGTRLDSLSGRIAHRLVPHPPPPGAAVPFTPDLGAGVEAVASALDASDTATARDRLRALIGRPDFSSHSP